MSSATPITTEKILTRVLREVQSLRRETSMFIPLESIDEYANKQEINSAYNAVQTAIRNL